MLVHMVPQFALLAAPAARIRRVPLAALVHALARRACPARSDERLSMSFSASTARAFRSPLRRCGGSGHAIDVERFAPGRHGKTVTGRCDSWRSGARRVGRGSRRCSGPSPSPSPVGPTFASRSGGRRSPTTSAHIGSSSNGSWRTMIRCAGVSKSSRRSLGLRSPRSSPPPTSSSARTSHARARPSTRLSSRPQRAGDRCCRRIPPSLHCSAAWPRPLLAPARDPEALAEAISALSEAGATTRARIGERAARAASLPATRSSTGPTR